MLESILLVVALSMDAFVASFAYGSDKIKIPFLSVTIINIICSSILGISLLVGAIIRQYIPPGLTTAICFTMLFVLGLVKLLDSVTKSIIKKYNNFNKELKFSMFNFNFILNLYANPEDADVDRSNNLSALEAISLSIALSLDGLAIGFGAAMGNINILQVFLLSLISDMVAIMLGATLGNKIARKLSFNISWLSGVMLIILAFIKL